MRPPFPRCLSQTIRPRSGNVIHGLRATLHRPPQLIRFRSCGTGRENVGDCGARYRSHRGRCVALGRPRTTGTASGRRLRRARQFQSSISDRHLPRGERCSHLAASLVSSRMKSVPQVRCPSCKKVGPWFEDKFGPFCSRRCKLVDLGKWFSEENCISEPLRAEHLDKLSEMTEEETGGKRGRPDSNTDA